MPKALALILSTHVHAHACTHTHTHTHTHSGKRRELDTVPRVPEGRTNRIAIYLFIFSSLSSNDICVCFVVLGFELWVLCLLGSAIPLE
jgi:hypothetical protein